MTKTEILEKIDKGLRGQGNQVDIGNVLADVLTEIVNPTPLSLKFSNLSGENGAMTLTEFCAKLEITEAQAKALVSGGYPVLEITNNSSVVFLTLTSWLKDSLNMSARYIQGVDAENTGYIDCSFEESSDDYYITFVNV